MSAGELFKAGKLAEAIKAQIEDVKTNPADQSKRLFLFELLSFSGDLERARRQIDAIHYGDPDRDMTVATYRRLLDSEQARRRLFLEGQKPQFLVEPPFHVRIRLDVVINYLRGHRTAGALDLLDKAQQAASTVSVELNGKTYESFRDADDLFGTVLEVMAMGNYYWVPLEQIQSLAMNPPRFPRDLLWIPARLEMQEGATGEVFLPALYPDSSSHPDEQVKLGRMTDWNVLAPGTALGIGLRTFVGDDDELSILDWRQLQVPGAH